MNPWLSFLVLPRTEPYLCVRVLPPAPGLSNSETMLVLLTVVLAFLMPASGQRLTKEECARRHVCPREPILNFVCGSDGISYGNPCTFRFAQCGNPNLTLHSLGPCERKGC
ncbi:hypothetical protein H257_00871 [Aphanomyces astaci]|uniref:Kazal-like domain-containing protein n=1 Tax=Aphanomyces astaci TaxID=112090 RepID=W4HCG8_APHAT|nr:hypothetical protein H257_00871 [Aphanomyces astaci]ETV89680.1 hypothetical protein H257_00871 [Aphanomyces astaci]|eukprot:XP_009822080.1 hypothetical protein H257_00871 [Aphanomyces astaci]